MMRRLYTTQLPLVWTTTQSLMLWKSKHLFARRLCNKTASSLSPCLPPRPLKKIELYILIMRAAPSTRLWLFFYLIAMTVLQCLPTFCKEITGPLQTQQSQMPKLNFSWLWPTKSKVLLSEQALISLRPLDFWRIWTRPCTTAQLN